MTGELFLTFTRRLIFGFLLIAMVACATHGHGQTSGTVGIATKLIQVFNSQTTTLSSGGTWQCNNSPVPITCPFLPDIGSGVQASYISYCNTSFTGTLALSWTPTGIINNPSIVLLQANYQIGSPDSNCHSFSLGGYFPNMYLTVTPNAGSMSAWYTASAAPIPTLPPALGSNGPTAPVACDKLGSFTVTNGSTTLAVSPILPGDTLVICSATLSFAAATSTGSIQLEWGATGCTSLTAGWLMETTSSSPQALPIPGPLRTPPGSPAGQFVCMVNNSGATAVFALSYASVHGL